MSKPPVYLLTYEITGAQGTECRTVAVRAGDELRAKMFGFQKVMEKRVAQSVKLMNIRQQTLRRSKPCPS